MVFRPIAPTQVVDTSSLQGLGKTVLDLAQWAAYEFNAVASAFQSTESVKTWHSAPPKPRAGTMAYADGTNWNPGQGEGFYEYTSSGWVPMFVPPSWSTAWTAYTPTLSANSGTYTSASASGRYKQIGKICHVNLLIVLTTLGTGTYPIVGLPIQAGGGMTQWLGGREIQATGNVWQGQIPPSGTSAVVLRYDNGTTLANGYQIAMTGAYETV